MIQVYKKNDLFVIENTITETIYPNLTREETVELLKKFDRDEPEDRCDFAIKEDNISFEYASLDDKDRKIADLEAKLAESEKKNFELVAKLNLKEHKPAFCTLADRDCEAVGKIAELQKQLAEKDKAIENWQTIYESVVQTCHNDKEEIERLNKKLAEKDKKIEKLNACVDFYKSYYISFKDKVIDELEKVKRYIDDNAYYVEEDNFGIEINEYIDTQINELKGKVEDEKRN